MNKKRILELADTIELQQHAQLYSVKIPVKGFNMGRFFHACGTPCCIAGFAVAMFAPDVHEDDRTACASHYAHTLLGISEAEGRKLFLPEDFSTVRLRWNDITPKRAAKVLRHYVDTGKIDWHLQVEGEPSWY